VSRPWYTFDVTAFEPFMTQSLSSGGFETGRSYDDKLVRVSRADRFSPLDKLTDTDGDGDGDGDDGGDGDGDGDGDGNGDGDSKRDDDGGGDGERESKGGGDGDGDGGDGTGQRRAGAGSAMVVAGEGADASASAVALPASPLPESALAIDDEYADHVIFIDDCGGDVMLDFFRISCVVVPYFPLRAWCAVPTRAVHMYSCRCSYPLDGVIEGQFIASKLPRPIVRIDLSLLMWESGGTGGRSLGFAAHSMCRLPLASVFLR
jgi:hypothetical protein